MKEAIETIRKIGEGIIALADQLEATPIQKVVDEAKLPEEEAVKLPEEEQAVPEKEEKPIKFEDVRAALAEISQGGKTAEMKALIAKYGTGKLSDVDPSKYAALLAEAEVIKNA